jgi:Raf kinase inhibitor-like YbhB/YbcL family protein
MKVWSESFAHGTPIPDRCAFARPHPEQHVELSDNASPHLAWEDLPAGTKSIAIVCLDSDAPTRPDDVNQEGRTVPADLPRADFAHWALVDLKPEDGPLAEGAFSKGVTPRGKAQGDTPKGRAGLNDYTSWFQGDADMEGQYFGYDGPCPPWNDERVHNYHFHVLALDVETLPVEGAFGAGDVLKAAEGHILDRAVLSGTFTFRR